jgi:hypothetical protein
MKVHLAKLLQLSIGRAGRPKRITTLPATCLLHSSDERTKRVVDENLLFFRGVETVSGDLVVHECQVRARFVEVELAPVFDGAAVNAWLQNQTVPDYDLDGSVEQHSHSAVELLNAELAVGQAHAVHEVTGEHANNPVVFLLVTAEKRGQVLSRRGVDVLVEVGEGGEVHCGAVEDAVVVVTFLLRAFVADSPWHIHNVVVEILPNLIEEIVLLAEVIG